MPSPPRLVLSWSAGALCAALARPAAADFAELVQRAEEPTPSARTLTLSPSPDVPLFGLSWRDGARGTLGAALPLAGERGRTPLALLMPALVELHNAGRADSEVPNESWRGRIALELWASLHSSARRRVSLGLALEHESDHETSRWDSSADFYSFNDVALRGAHLFKLGFAQVGLSTDARLFVLSCSRTRRCDGLQGSTATGAEAAVVLDLSPGASFAGLSPYAAVAAGGIAEHGDVMGEARAVAHAGLWTRGARGSRWSFFALAFLGNDVGITRTRRVRQLGAGVRWAP